MNVVRAMLFLFLAVSLKAYSSTPFTQAHLSEVSFHLPVSLHNDWQAAAKRSYLENGSPLFEYVAQTQHVNSQSSVIVLSFVPRFNCGFSVSVRVPYEAGGSGDTRATLELTFNDKQLSYDSLVEFDEKYTTYAIHSDAGELQQLRKALEAGWVLSVAALSPSDEKIMDSESTSGTGIVSIGGSQTDETSAFSLFGSADAITKAEEYCNAHLSR